MLAQASLGHSEATEAAKPPLLSANYPSITRAIKCRSTHLSRPQLCTYLSFATTQDLQNWEQQDPKRSRTISGWISQHCPPNHIAFPVEEVVKAICTAHGPPTVSLQNIEKPPRWVGLHNFPGKQARECVEFANMSDEDVRLVYCVAVMCVCLIRDDYDDGQGGHFPESGVVDEADGEYVGTHNTFYYAPEGVNRAFEYVRNRVNRPWEGKVKMALPAAAIDICESEVRASTNDFDEADGQQSLPPITSQLAFNTTHMVK